MTAMRCQLYERCRALRLLPQLASLQLRRVTGREFDETSFSLHSIKWRNYVKGEVYCGVNISGVAPLKYSAESGATR